MKINKTYFIYSILFLTTIGYALILYINSSFLGQFIPERTIGLLYGIGSFLSLVILSNISKILKKFGHLKTTVAILCIEILSISGMAYLDSIKNSGLFVGVYKIAAISLIFLLFYIPIILLRLSLDLYLEKFSKNSETGKARGVYLTVMNLAVMISPFIVGKILVDGNYFQIYYYSAIVFIPAFFILVFGLRDVRDLKYHDAPFWKTLPKLWKNKDMFGVFATNFLLEFFYAWMTIYTPLYLNSVIGFSWAEIGTMFAIMLSPFVFIQFPLGEIADKYLGEKEILTAGFAIAGSSTILLAFIDTPDFITWTAVLFTTRIGAAAIEVMNETYFFKKVSAKDSDIMGFFRNGSPLAYIIAPLSASAILYFTSFNYLFLILGLITLSGIFFALSIEDTL